MDVTERINREHYWEEGFQEGWSMSHSEKAALIQLMSRLKPEISIEIGTAYGGSLQVIAGGSGKVHTFDISAYVKPPVADAKNVEFHIGDSKETLPEILEKIDGEGALNFALVDGDHSRQGVLGDIQHFLGRTPKHDLVIVMHDSFNPEVRAGIVEADWEGCPYVQYVEVDWIAGNLFNKGRVDGEMWGGFALAKLSPEPRNGELVVSQRSELSFDACLGASKHAKGRKSKGFLGWF